MAEESNKTQQADEAAVAATENAGTTADAAAGDATTPAAPADVDVVAEADVIAPGADGTEADAEALAEAESTDTAAGTETPEATSTDDVTRKTEEAVEEAVAEQEAEATAEAEAEEDKSIFRKVVDAVEDIAEDVIEAVEDAAAALRGREDLEEEPTSIDGRADLETPEGKVGFTGEIQGKVVKLEDLLNDGDADEEAFDENMMSLYEQTFSSVNENEIVTGRVVRIGEKDVVIDIGFKSDGIVAKNEFDAELAAGDDVEVYIERLEDRNGQLVLSKRRADDLSRWMRIESAFDNESVVEGEIIRRIKGGMIVELWGKEAFLPGSQVDVRPVRDFDDYIGKRMEFKVVKINPGNGNVVVSHKALIEKDLEEQRKKILGQMEVGQILEGTVKNITDFGVFLDLGGVDGLLHITDLSWGRVQHPSEVVNLDEKLNIVVLDYDKDRQRISLGLKQLLPHPWEGIEERYAKGQIVEGKVVSITDYGAFVELEKGIEGLVHISEMSWTEHVKHPTQKVSLGQKVEVKILNLDTEDKKISLGMKQLEPDPWENVLDKYPTGTVTRGIVRNITNFGAFVELEPGIDGLVHVSDLSWTKKVRNPSDVVRKGQDLDVVVLDVDGSNRRMSLGHKQVETNPWNQFAQAYAVDTDLEASIERFSEDGAVVELPLGVEGFIPATHLDKSGSMQAAYQVGDTLELRVIRFDPENREIVLSERARKSAAIRAEKQAERAEKQEQYKRERKEIDSFQKREASGPATIGELSGLAGLKAKMEAAEANAAAAEPEMETQPSHPQQDEATKTSVEGGEVPAEDKAAIKDTGATEAPAVAAEALADAENATEAEATAEAEVPETLDQPAHEAVQELQGEDPKDEEPEAAEAAELGKASASVEGDDADDVADKAS